MGRIDLIKAVQKTNDVIASCETCVHVKNTENYLENFKQTYNNEVFYKKLLVKLLAKKNELNCDFRI